MSGKARGVDPSWLWTVMRTTSNHRVAALAALSTGMFLLFFGVAFAGIAWIVLHMNEAFPDGVDDVATIVAVDRDTLIVDGVPRNNYIPTYEYDDPTGRIFRVADARNGSGTAPRVGDTVEINYRLDDPADVRRPDIEHTWLWSFVAIGGVAILASFVMFAVALGAAVRRRPQQPTGKLVPHTG